MNNEALFLIKWVIKNQFNQELNNKLLKLLENNNNNEITQTQNINLIDLRSSEEFSQSHFPHSTNIPYTEFLERIYELPPRSSNLAIYYNDNDKNIQISQISDSLKNYNFIIFKQSSLLYQFSHNNSNNLLEELQCESGIEKSIILWKACKYLEESIDFIENSLFLKYKTTTTSEIEEKKKIQLLNAIDIACGSGRDCLYLLNRKNQVRWNIYGVDNDEILLNKMILAANRLVTDSQSTIHSLLLDLEAFNPDDFNDKEPNIQQLEHLDKIKQLLLLKEPNGFDLVHVARYLYRPLFRVLTDIIRKNGFILYHTFMEPSHGKPKRKRFLLKVNELKQIFTEPIFKVIHYHETFLDDGRPIQVILAQKL
ncbi:hypothetical protein DLAC_00701 [Tieghemostelium lacteum]|uniref:Rhodanese domain-containing protein n=1 Tax=Tieghemostelium lacteum TaxID=361077 RepID=A0A152A6P9_TIELA|nr:hypothetical protein DLAC_00701 [Tieghemostelium lacteum]|eukprot:KYR01912.1 hypothetical protein DLAC_00701 [Tieghemostelium lacteum]